MSARQYSWHLKQLSMIIWLKELHACAQYNMNWISTDKHNHIKLNKKYHWSFFGLGQRVLILKPLSFIIKLRRSPSFQIYCRRKWYKSSQTSSQGWAMQPCLQHPTRQNRRKVLSICIKLSQTCAPIILLIFNPSTFKLHNIKCKWLEDKENPLV